MVLYLKTQKEMFYVISMGYQRIIAMFTILLNIIFDIIIKLYAVCKWYKKAIALSYFTYRADNNTIWPCIAL